MITSQQFERIVYALPILARADAGLLSEFQQAATFMRFPPDMMSSWKAIVSMRSRC